MFNCRVTIITELFLILIQKPWRKGTASLCFIYSFFTLINPYRATYFDRVKRLTGLCLTLV